MNAPRLLEPDQQIAWLSERAAVLQCALRRLACAHHRTHADEKLVSWVSCPDHFCQLAHDAVEGRMRPRNQTEHGTVISLIKKEA